MYKVFTLFLLLFATPAAAEKPVAPESVSGTIRITAEQVVQLILDEPAVVVIDSRRPEEHAKGHVEGAVSLLDSDMTPRALARHVPTRDTPVIFYCNGERCMRSSNAARLAVSWGYNRVYWFRGGWSEWLAKGLPVTRQ